MLLGFVQIHIVQCRIAHIPLCTQLIVFLLEFLGSRGIPLCDMMLFLKLPTSRVITSDVAATDTIYELKLMIHKNVGIHPSQQHLVYIENLFDLDLNAWNTEALRLLHCHLSVSFGFRP